MGWSPSPCLTVPRSKELIFSFGIFPFCALCFDSFPLLWRRFYLGYFSDGMFTHHFFAPPPRPLALSGKIDLSFFMQKIRFRFVEILTADDGGILFSMIMRLFWMWV